MQLGGQTALGLAKGLEAAGIPILGTSPDAIDLAEERGLFSGILDEAGLLAPKNGTAIDVAGAVHAAEGIGYPVLVRPSYVLGGRGMEIVYDSASLADYFVRIEGQGIVGPSHPLLVDRFLDDAIEIDVDALYDGTELYIGGVMEHIEEAGIHSGDSSCTLPPVTLGRAEVDRVREATRAIAQGIGVQGLLNVQFAVAAGVLYVLEANPRASRTVPFVSKALGIPLAKAASRIMVGATIAELIAEGMLPASDGSRVPLDSPVAVKEAVLPFHRFRTREGIMVDSVLGPEMRSTGEVMGIDKDFPTAFAKSQLAAYGGMPLSGTVFVSVSDRDKRAIILPVLRMQQLGYEIAATEGTAEVLRRNGIQAQEVLKFSEKPDGRRGIRRRTHPPRRGRRRREHAQRTFGARRRLRDPRGRSRGGHPALHDHRRALGSRRLARRGARRVRGDEPPGVRGAAGGVGMNDLIPFGERLEAVFAAYGRLCVGLDPHASLLDDWGQPDSAEGLREFGLRVIEAAADRVGIVKPQVAFFERHGAAGYAVLERLLAEARDAGLLVIADVKRGDIGTSVAAYGEAWLTPGSTLEADAMTISAYQGLGSIEQVMVAAESAAKGLFVLAATSNPEAAAIQRAVLQQSSRAGSTVAQAITGGRHRLEPGASGCRNARARLDGRRVRRDRRPPARGHRHGRRAAAAGASRAGARIRPSGRRARGHPPAIRLLRRGRHRERVAVAARRRARWHRRRDRASRRRVRSGHWLTRPRPPRRPTSTASPPPGRRSPRVAPAPP